VSGRSWALAIDLGTSFTTAAISVGGLPPAVLPVAGTPYFPSAVALDGADGAHITGPEAVRQSLLAPEVCEPAPKRALALGAAVVLSGRPAYPAELVAAVFCRVREAARGVAGDQPPGKVVLTHPARWSARQLSRLRTAAGMAFPSSKLKLLAEPVAAAWMYPVQPQQGALIGVVDLGISTATTLVRADANGLRIVGAPGGDPHLGGDDFDEALLVHVTGLAAARGEQAWQAPLAGDTEWLGTRAQLRGAVTAAKERLSGTPTTNIAIPGAAEFRVTRAEFQSLISGKIDAVIGHLRQTIAAAGAAPADLTVVYLAGGSASTPLLATSIETSLGVRTELASDPKAAVALGALAGAATEPGWPGRSQLSQLSKRTWLPRGPRR
jgi:molecular chaperone DnaK